MPNASIWNVFFREYFEEYTALQGRYVHISDGESMGDHGAFIELGDGGMQE